MLITLYVDIMKFETFRTNTLIDGYLRGYLEPQHSTSIPVTFDLRDTSFIFQFNAESKYYMITKN